MLGFLKEIKMVNLKEYHCRRCGGDVNDNISKDQYSQSEYFAYCPNCDEDMYQFELEFKGEFMRKPKWQVIRSADEAVLSEGITEIVMKGLAEFYAIAEKPEKYGEVYFKVVYTKENDND